MRRLSAAAGRSVRGTGQRRVYADLAALIAEPSARIAAASGPPVTRIGDVRMSYLAAAALLDRRFFYAGGQWIDSASPALHAAPGGMADTNGAVDVQAVAEKLYYAIDVGNLAVVSQLIAETGRGLIRHGKAEADIKAAFAGIVTALAGKLSQSGDERQLDNDRLSACMSAIYGHVRYDELEEELIAVLPALSKGSGACSGDKQIKKMIDLIRRNYVENLKLETLAEVFNYNSAYLGKLFKNETGEIFQYLPRQGADREGQGAAGSRVEGLSGRGEGRLRERGLFPRQIPQIRRHVPAAHTGRSSGLVLGPKSANFHMILPAKL